MKIYTTNLAIYNLEGLLYVEKGLHGYMPVYPCLLLAYKDGTKKHITFYTAKQMEEAFEEITKILKGE